MKHYLLSSLSSCLCMLLAHLFTLVLEFLSWEEIGGAGLVLLAPDCWISPQEARMASFADCRSLWSSYRRMVCGGFCGVVCTRIDGMGNRWRTLRGGIWCAPGKLICHLKSGWSLHRELIFPEPSAKAKSTLMRSRFLRKKEMPIPILSK